MSGRELLVALLRLEGEQTAALSDGDLELFETLCNRRGEYVQALSSADWSDAVGVPQVAREVVASGERMVGLVRREMAIVSAELGNMHRMATTLRGYRQLPQASRSAAVVVDRSA